MLKKMTALLHVDDPERADTYTKLVSHNARPYEELGEREQTLARMLFFTLWPDGGGFDEYDEGFEQLRAYPYACAEISQLMQLGVSAARHAPKGLGPGLQHIPLYSHATYRREEVLAALGIARLGVRDAKHREGVAWSPGTSTDAFFVTLNKDEKKHSATTMYRDYALSEDLFHWESQNSTLVDSPTGQRYVNRKAHGSQILLFTRDKANDDDGLTAPYTCLGQLDYVRHLGERPIAIVWKLQRAMPADVYLDASAVAG